MRRRALVLFSLSFLGILVWMCSGQRKDARQTPSERFQLVALLGQGEAEEATLLRWPEAQERRAKGEAMAFLIPQAQEEAIGESLRRRWVQEGGDTLTLRVTRLGPDRQRIQLRTVREGFGGPLFDTSTYEATAAEVFPREERVQFFSMMTLVLSALLAGVFTVGVLVPWALAEWILKRRGRR